MNAPHELPEYIKHADSKEDGERMYKQFHAMSTTRKDVTCRCGGRFTAAMMYRCWFCGEYFCIKCSPAHFGGGINERRKEKEDESRNQKIEP